MPLYSNNAGGLKTRSSVVTVYTSNAPTANQVLTAQSGSVATWATPSGGGISVSSTTAVSSIWTKPASATVNSQVYIQLWGGGGSGGSSTGSGEAGGGGGGGYAEAWFPASILSSLLVTVGRGGNSRNSAANSTGLPGGITVLMPHVSMLTAWGGGGGGAGANGGAGGGGAGMYETGLDGSGTTPGRGGYTGGGWSQGAGDGRFTVNLGVNSSLLAATYVIAEYGGAGGFGGQSGTGPASLIGQNANYGGGGGGGISSSVTSGSALGGYSTYGGNGGKSSILTSGSAMAGVVPGGGGGASNGQDGASSGAGATGLAVFTVFI